MVVTDVPRTSYYGGKYPRVAWRPTAPPAEDDPTNPPGRTGGCAEECGACCEFMVFPLDPRILTSPNFVDWAHWVELHGGSILIDRKRGWVDLRISQPCSQLQLDARCGLIVDDRLNERPEMCSKYPQSKAEQVGLEHVCTYRFEEDDESSANNGDA